MISLKDYITASGKYPEREKSPDLTPEVIKNAEQLLSKVNNVLNTLGIKNVIVSSGFRPSDVNKGIKGAAVKSNHLIGKAIDLSDPKGELDRALEINQELLEAYGLWQEHPSKTINWAHLDMGDRPIKDRPNCKKRQFLP
jgi:hypothetical protein